MAGSKSDRKVNAKFSIFANNEAANDEVRVGYIDSKRGYVSGLTVYEANRYAERNPGTQFISANRDAVRYLNINEVNALTILSEDLQLIQTMLLRIMLVENQRSNHLLQVVKMVDLIQKIIIISIMQSAKQE